MARILNFGSLNIDYVYHVDHFVAPGETISSFSREVNCGGKGLNQSIALAASGATVLHAGKIGPDGKILTDLLESSGVSTALVDISGGPSGHAIIQVDKNGQNSIILFSGANHEILPEMITCALDHLEPGDTIVLQNEISRIPEIMSLASALGIRIVFNPSPITPEMEDYPLELVSMFVLNEIEGEALSGTSDFSAMPDALRERFPGATFLLTFGSRGSVYVTSDRIIKYGIHKAPVVDTTAAGDTILGFFTGLTAGGTDPEKALEIATKAAAITVSRKGAAPSIPTLEEAEACPFPYVPFDLF